MINDIWENVKEIFTKVIDFIAEPILIICSIVCFILAIIEAINCNVLGVMLIVWLGVICIKLLENIG